MEPYCIENLLNRFRGYSKKIEYAIPLKILSSFKLTKPTLGVIQEISDNNNYKIINNV